MMDFLLYLIIASLVGTILCIVQNIFKLVTRKLFSHTWHYYSSLIPVFFFLGGTKIITALIDLIGSVLTYRSKDLIYQPTKFTEGLFYITKAEQYLEDASPINQLFTILTKLENISEIMMWVLYIWASGMIIFLVLNFKKYVSFKHFVLQNHRVHNTKQTTSKVIISVNAKSPMAMGFLKPIVILPDVNFNEKELNMILSHELTHIKRGDLLFKLMIMFAKAVHWFNPSIYFLSRQINSYCELSCDEKVVQEMDMESRKSYGEMILTVLDYGVKKRSIIDVACVSNLYNTKNNIKRRLLNIMNSKKMKKSMIALSVSVMVLLIGIGAFATYGSESQVFGGVFNAIKSDKITFEDNGIVVVNEDPKLLEEFDITNKTLEEYLDSIEDPTKKLLLEKYFYLPFDLIPEENRINNLDPLSQAEIMSKLSNEELKDIVDKMEAKIPELKEKKEQEYNDIFKDSDFHLSKGVNENGQTYGIESEDSPDLVAAQGIDGTYGYILSNDLYGPEFSTPEEAVEWQKKHKGKRVIPLYANDGKTVIGEFVLEALDGIE